MRYIKLSEEEYWSVYLRLNACTFYIITYGLHYLATFVPLAAEAVGNWGASHALISLQAHAHYRMV